MPRSVDKDRRVGIGICAKNYATREQSVKCTVGNFNRSCIYDLRFYMRDKKGRDWSGRHALLVRLGLAISSRICKPVKALSMAIAFMFLSCMAVCCQQGLLSQVVSQYHI
ncbi:hypothetical protein SADUNF_Sadunf09G0060900 [Salix dunnii]|uniref:Uncharacterized protein n=1 Tax=Salix dunnii TaxID=1413687 RepID=A0A835MW64_9ROSI|nr:hypothetical protein SADUNF_Sadunf09G0060900 [Salix dunnii]